MSSRDDFTKKTVDILARRAGGKCSICESSTYGPNDNPYTATNIGKAAHIAAASEGGPRYDPAMSPEVRKSLKNGIWLCSNCHDKIDRNPESYPIKYLQGIKKEAEKRAREQLGVPQATHDKKDDGLLTRTISSIAIVEVRKIRAGLPCSLGSSISKSEALRVLSAIEFIDFNREEYLPQVGGEVLKLLFHLVSYKKHNPEVYLETIRHVQDIVGVFIAELGKEEMTGVCELIKRTMADYKVRSSVYQSSLALLKDIARKVKDSGNRDVGGIVDQCFREVVQKVGGGKGKEVEGYEDTDNANSDEEKGLPPPKRRRGLGQEENKTIQYLEKMLHLGGLTTPTNTKKTEDIEEEITDMGFEPHII